VSLGWIIVPIGYFLCFFPFKIGVFDPRLILIVCGIVCGALGKIKKSYLKLLAPSLFVSLWAIFSIIINGSDDLTFVIYPLQLTYLLFLSICAVSIHERCFGRVGLKEVIGQIILVFIVQAVIAILMFFIPSVRDAVMEIQGDEMLSDGRGWLENVRLIGLGCFYFGAGTGYGFCLILLALIIINRKLSGKEKTKYLLLYWLFVVVGLLFARTTVVGFAVSILMILSDLFRRRVPTLPLKRLRDLLVVGVLLVGALVVIVLNSDYLLSEYSNLFEFGFELFINIFSGDGATTASSEALKTLYVWPNDVYTYVWGDGHWNGENGLYYMNTDVGYLRLIYYFGIPGLLLVFWQFYQCYTFSRKYIADIRLRGLFLWVFVYSCILNLKGFADCTYLLFPIMVVLASQCKTKRLSVV